MEGPSHRADDGDRRTVEPVKDGDLRPTRRSVLATGAAITAGLAGCLGGEGSPTATGTSEPSAPYTTEGLASFIDGDETLTIYAGTGDDQQWHDLIDVLNDEYGTNLSVDVFASDGGAVSQRVIQERQADDDKSDLVSAASDITAEIREKGQDGGGLDVAKKYFEWDMDTKFWFADEIDDKRLLPFMLGAFNGGATSVMSINTAIFEEQGLPVPDSYNDLFADEFAGVRTFFPGFVVSKEIGWIAKYHADQRGMDPVDWVTELKDHLEFVGAKSYGPALKSVGRGEGAIDFHNFPWFASSIIQKFDDLQGVFVDPVKAEATAGTLHINKHAPNPWAARFVASAIFETPVQRRMVTDIADQTPVRVDDIDISALDVSPYMKKRLEANTELLGFWELGEYTKVGQEIKSSGVFDDL